MRGVEHTTPENPYPLAVHVEGFSSWSPIDTAAPQRSATPASTSSVLSGALLSSVIGVPAAIVATEIVAFPEVGTIGRYEIALPIDRMPVPGKPD